MLKFITQAFIVSSTLKYMLMGFRFAQRNTQSKEKHEELTSKSLSALSDIRKSHMNLD